MRVECYRQYFSGIPLDSSLRHTPISSDILVLLLGFPVLFENGSRIQRFRSFVASERGLGNGSSDGELCGNAGWQRNVHTGSRDAAGQRSGHALPREAGAIVAASDDVPVQFTVGGLFILDMKFLLSLMATTVGYLLKMPMLCLKGDDHSNTVLKTLENLLESNVLVDCTLAAGGRFLKAHRIILSSCSPYFQLLFSQDTNQQPIIVFKDIEYKYLKMILEYVYHGSVQIPHTQLNTFLDVANSLQIIGLDTRGRELLSEESGSQIFDCNMKGITTPILQQCSEDESDSKFMNKINPGYVTNLGPTPAPVQADVHTLDSTSTIHIQSVYSLTSESTSIPDNLVPEDSVKSTFEVANSKCDIKVEPLTQNINRNGGAIDTTEQTTMSSRNKYSPPEDSAQVGQINSRENLDTANASVSNRSSKNKHPYPDSLTHPEQLNLEENCGIEPLIGKGVRIKRVRKNPFSSDLETQVAKANDKLLIKNASGTTEQVNNTEAHHYPESISLPTKASTNEIRVRNATNPSELASSVNGVKSSKQTTNLPECVVQAERIVIDKYFEGNLSSTQQRKVSKFRVLHPRRKHSEKSHTIKEEKSIRVPVKEEKEGNKVKQDDQEEKAAKFASAHDLNLPVSTKVTIIPAGSGIQKTEGKRSRSNSSLDEKSDDNGEEKVAKFVSAHGINLPLSTKVIIIPAGSGSQKSEGRKSRSNSSQDEKSVVDKSKVLNQDLNHPSSSSEKMWSCNTCDKQFRNNISLVHHMQLHTGEQPFSCTSDHGGLLVSSTGWMIEEGVFLLGMVVQIGFSIKVNHATKTLIP
ncbi:Longitudinals lacking protein, isoform G [Gryllus bimaculatus]|nr:Longitudinals lacking protein, isoform G [Gryllus bimaculatus]